MNSSRVSRTINRISKAKMYQNKVHKVQSNSVLQLMLDNPRRSANRNLFYDCKCWHDNVLLYFTKNTVRSISHFRYMATCKYLSYDT